MIKLLLKENIEILRKEYLSRFLIVASIFIITAAVIFGAILAATHIQVSIAKNIAENQVSNVRADEISKQRKELVEKSRLLNEQIAFLNKEIVNPSIFIDALTSSKNVGIILSGIVVDMGYIDPADKSGRKFIKIDVRGMADKRADLLAFQENLNKTSLFSVVDIPYSNFAKITNIQFTASLIPARGVKKTNNE